MKTLKTTLLVSALIVSAFALQAFRPALDASACNSVAMLDSTDADSLTLSYFAGDSTEADSLAFALGDTLESDSLAFVLGDTLESDSLMFMALGDSIDVDSLYMQSLQAFAGEDSTDDCGDKEKKEILSQFAFENFASDSTDVDSLMAV